LIGTKPCICGYLGHYSGRCQCTPDQILRYRSRISGPLLDRIDIQIEVPTVSVDELSCAHSGESSSDIRQCVERARAKMMKRQDKPNAKLTSADVERHCALTKDAAVILHTATNKLALSARGYHRILKVARTIADLAGAKDIAVPHLAEAVQYRKLDRALLSKVRAASLVGRSPTRNRTSWTFSNLRISVTCVRCFSQFDPAQIHLKNSAALHRALGAFTRALLRKTHQKSVQCLRPEA
jgi:hypothetical protein